jgi:hypothetical protein
VLPTIRTGLPAHIAQTENLEPVALG